MNRVFTIVLCLIVTACSSTTNIISSDPEAKIFVDGEYRGTGATTQTDKKIVGTPTQVTLRKEGCRPIHYTYTRSEVVNAWAIVGGVVLVPLLWVMNYKPSRTLEFYCEN